MLNPLSQRDNLLSFLTVGFLLTAGVNTVTASTLLSPFPTCKPPVHKDTLIGMEIKMAESPSSRYIRTERNSDLLISIPDAASGRYKIRFFDADNKLVFEIKQFRDSLLILEKYNFRHAGMFQFALYRDDTLLERSSFFIKRD
jgi:hypothetical protein